MARRLRVRLEHLERQYPDISEIREFREFLIQRKACVAAPEAMIEEWAHNSEVVARSVYRWVDYITRYPRKRRPPTREKIMETFQEKWEGASPFAPDDVRLRPDEVLLHRMLARILDRQGKRYIIINPPDLSAQRDATAQQVYWAPLQAALAGVPGLVMLDLSQMPMVPGRDMRDHVARTYYGNLKVADALLPRILELVDAKSSD